jgi:hypothetical protein
LILLPRGIPLFLLFKCIRLMRIKPGQISLVRMEETSLPLICFNPKELLHTDEKTCLQRLALGNTSHKSQHMKDTKYDR